MKEKIRLTELDLLRFLAAAAVVLHHVAGFQAGYLGVELFFMISGFVILMSARGKTPYEFLVSRFSRLYPTFWVCVAATALIASLAHQGVSGRTFAANLTMFPGPLGAPYVDIVYWTLFIEAEFYALVFLLMVCRQMKHLEAWLWAWFAASVAGAYFNWHWINIAGYAPFFIAGAMLYLIRTEGWRKERIALVVGCAALGALQGIRAGVEGNVTTPHWILGATVVVEAAVFLTLALKWWRLPNFALWGALGAMTYPLYLLHNRIGELMQFPVLVEVAMSLAGAYLLSRTVEVYGCRWVNRLLLKVPSLWGAPSRSEIPPPATPAVRPLTS